MPYVTERWLGGTLTNFRTIRERLKRLEELESLGRDRRDPQATPRRWSRSSRREKRKIIRNLDGIRTMTSSPARWSSIDVNRETQRPPRGPQPRHPDGLPHRHRRRSRARRHPDPGQRRLDAFDRRRSMRELCAARSRKARASGSPKDGKPSESGEAAPRRRSSRSQFRSDEPAAVAEEAVAEPAEPSAS